MSSPGVQRPSLALGGALTRWRCGHTPNFLFLRKHSPSKGPGGLWRLLAKVWAGARSGFCSVQRPWDLRRAAAGVARVVSLAGHLPSLDTCFPRQEGSSQLGQGPRSGPLRCSVATSGLASP